MWNNYKLPRGGIHALWTYHEGGELKHGLALHGIYAIRKFGAGGLRVHSRVNRRLSINEVRAWHKCVEALKDTTLDSSTVLGYWGRRPWRLFMPIVKVRGYLLAKKIRGG